ncbi:restriction endonuclease subunit S [Candidatus Electrothrix sp.]|uniref:restriction endonuclease subunit S n=1 Tax=Candidatus Electrothrix sp. TaxID=2170559 RepID=UPI00405688D1
MNCRGTARRAPTKQVGTGATVKGVKLPFVKSLQIPLPPTSEQQRLSEQLDALVAKTQHLESIYQKKLNALAELKQSILHKVFTGELTHSPEQELTKAC